MAKFSIAPGIPTIRGYSVKQGGKRVERKAEVPFTEEYFFGYSVRIIRLAERMGADGLRRCPNSRLHDLWIDSR